jgi:prepilin-type N-terminal cleavage/methylation domain-containing protein
MSPLHRPNNADVPAGFSLMEVMIALVVLTIGLMSIALLMTNVYKSTVRSRYMSLAATFASEKLEDLNSYGLNDPRAHLAGGSLTSNLVPQTEPWNSSNVLVNFYDTVTLNNSTGAMNETYEILNGGTVEYVTQSFTADGIWHWDSTDGFPSVPTTTAPTGITFTRRWVIEANTPVTGLTRITVLVTLDDDTVQPPVTFQMSTVRP